MKTPGEWGQAWNPPRLNKPSNIVALPWIVTNFSLFWVIWLKKDLAKWTLIFFWLLIFLWIHVNIVIIYFLIWKGNRGKTMTVDTMPLAMFTDLLFGPLVSTKWHCLGSLSNLCVVGLSRWMFAIGDMALKMVSTLVPPSSTPSSHALRSEEA